MFLNTYHHSLDNKGRLMIQSKYREEIGASRLVVTKGVDRNLVVFTMEGFEHYVGSLKSLQGSPEKARRLKRFLASSAYDLKLDAQGRILLSEELRDYAQISREAVVTGNMDNFEIWNEEAWKQQDALLSDAEGINSDLEELGMLL